MFDQIKSMLEKDDLVLFMKGSKNSPLCGFSARVVNILNALGVSFQEYNVLEDENLRSAIKKFSNWPTIPQLYFQGQFLGGCNVVDQMYKTGEIQKILKNKI